MKTNHTKDEQSEVRGIVEEFAQAWETSNSPYDRTKKDLDFGFLVYPGEDGDEMYHDKDAVINWLTQTLTHLQDNHEREKRELVEEVLVCLQDGIWPGKGNEHTNNVLKGKKNDIKSIAARHGLSTKEN